MSKAVATTVRFVNFAKAAKAGTALHHDLVAAPTRVIVDYRNPGRRVVLVPVKGTPTLRDIREGLSKAMATLKDLKVPAANVVLPTRVKRFSSSASCLAMNVPHASSVVSPMELERLATQWALSSQYRYTRMLTTDTEPHAADRSIHARPTIVPRSVRRGLKAQPLEAIKPAHLKLFRGTTKFATNNVMAGQAVANAMNRVRTLGNMRSDEATPEHIAEVAEEMAMYRNVTVRAILNKDEIKSQGLHLIHAVGQAAVRPPVLVVLEYIGAPQRPTTTALVGKGVTMDTGGLNIKTSTMHTMYMDMMGAAAVLGAFEAVAHRKLPVNVVCALGLAENAVGSNAYQPGQILRSLRGTTVEVINTDAEGRLVLADVMTYVQTKLPVEAKKVRTIIDVATLTGSCAVALGENRGGLFANNSALRSDLYVAGERALEPLWPLPVGPEHERAIKGSHSDLVNIPTSRLGGSSTAAAFLKHFVNKGVRWAHLDIAGPGFGEKPTGTQEGVAGFGVQLLTEYFIKEAAENKLEAKTSGGTKVKASTVFKKSTK